jgi:hypothetical protein
MATARLSVEIKKEHRRFALEMPTAGKIACTVSIKFPDSHAPPSAKAEKALAKQHARQLCEALMVALENY